MEQGDKFQLMRELIEDIKSDISPSRIRSNRNGLDTNVSLVNQFRLHKHIPNKWFDWTNTVTKSEIMIIGQDWGPYLVLKEFISSFDESKANDIDYYRKFLFKDFSSRTEKFILNTVQETYKDKFNEDFTAEMWDKIFFTMAVLFTRQGKLFRGNQNFDEKKSFEISYPYVKRQIDIVQPKLIIPLGNLAFSVINRYYGLEYTDIKISKIINSLEGGFIHLNSVSILPNYHPAAHVDPKVQKAIWEKMWNSNKI
ncbi:hypothetical protein HYV12_00555 [Candidatus Dojkabacteria bacterium]|nr:hypothetical protein [Candidatus Dojkabacteria bacterium]